MAEDIGRRLVEIERNMRPDIDDMINEARGNIKRWGREEALVSLGGTITALGSIVPDRLAFMTALLLMRLADMEELADVPAGD